MRACYELWTTVRSTTIHAVLLCIAIALPALAGDWPAYRHDAARSARSDENLTFPVSTNWVFSPPPASVGTRHVAVVNRRLYFGSPDHKVCALDVATGAPAWTVFTEAAVRFAPFVAQNRVYAGADDGRVYALDADSGKTVWIHDVAPGTQRVLEDGQMVSRRPIRAGLLVDRGTVLFQSMPIGGGHPATHALDAATGKPLERKTRQWLPPSCDGYLRQVNRASPGAHPYRETPSRVITARRLFRLTGESLEAHRLPGKPPGRDTAGPAAGPETLVWRSPSKARALILAGHHLIAGGPGRVTAFTMATGEDVWTRPVPGTVGSLAVAGQRLYVSCDNGSIVCFAADDLALQRSSPATRPGNGAPMDEGSTALMLATGTLVTPDTSGQALLLNIRDPRAPVTLTTHSRLRATVVRDRPGDTDDMRRSLDAAGVYGSRVFAVTAQTNSLPFPSYFANLVLCDGRGISTMKTALAEMFRVLRPDGGMAIIGTPDPDAAEAKRCLAQLETLLADRREFGTTLSVTTNAIVMTRGPLAGGAMAWDHPRATAGATGCSGDQLLRGTLGLSWIDQRLPVSTPTTPLPVSSGGRLFLCDGRTVAGVDAFNGTRLWSRNLAAGTGTAQGPQIGSMISAPAGVYVTLGSRCIRLDAASGNALATNTVPGATDGLAWDYLAMTGNRLVGSATAIGGAGRLFAIHSETGQLLWTHEVAILGRGAVCVYKRRLLYVDRPLSGGDTCHIACLDIRSGEIEWEHNRPVQDITGGGGLLAMAARNVLVLSSASHLTAIAADTGTTLWTSKQSLRSRPCIVGSRIVAEPWAFDLLTGEPLQRQNPISGAHASWTFARPFRSGRDIAAGAYSLLMASPRSSHYDLLSDHGVSILGTHRGDPGACALVANGLAFVAGTMTAAFAPQPSEQSWGLFAAPGAGTPVERLNLNMGAPGDRRAPDRRLWVGFPRRSAAANLLQLPVSNSVPFNTYYAPSTESNVVDTDTPWLYSSGLTGPARIRIHLNSIANATSQYAVRLHFAEEPGVNEGARVFDVAIDGRPVLENFDIAREAGAPGRALVREFRGLRPGPELHIELLPVHGRPRLCALEVIREIIQPTVSDMVISALENTVNPILLPARFPDGAAMLTATHIVRPPRNGTLSHLSSTRYTYVPAEKFVGLDAFEWQAIEAGQTSTTARVTVLVKGDTTKPLAVALDNTGSRHQARLVFSERMDKPTAERAMNYRMDRGISVVSARLDETGKQVLLGTSEMIEGDTYRLTIRDVFDTALTPNRIRDDTKIAFTFSQFGLSAHDRWTGIGGHGLAKLRSHATFPATPDRTATAKRLLGTPSAEPDDATRVRARLQPPVAGEYTFWLTGETPSELRVGTGETNADLILLASSSTPKSERIPLAKGKRYHLEILYTGRGDDLALHWQIPGRKRQPISSRHFLAPAGDVGTSATTPQSTPQP